MSETNAVPHRWIDGVKVLGFSDIPHNILTDIIATAKRCLKTDDCDGGFVDSSSVEMIKKELDERWSPCWHVTAGRNFGSHVVHEKQRFTYFYLKQTAVLVYKKG